MEKEFSGYRADARKRIEAKLETNINQIVLPFLESDLPMVRAIKDNIRYMGQPKNR